MTAKVLEFPKSKIVREVPISDEETKALREKVKLRKVEDVVQEVSSELFSTLVDDLDIEASPKFTEDFAFVMDSLRACIYRAYGVDHDLHELIDESMKDYDLHKVYIDINGEKKFVFFDADFDKPEEQNDNGDIPDRIA